MLQYLIDKPEVANAIATIASAILAAVACVIAVISLQVSRKTLQHQHEHNRMSVRPLASIMVGDFENRLYVKLVNNGVGPMIITRLIVPGATEPNRALIFHMPDLHPKVFWTTFVEDTSGRSIQPGSEIVLLDLDSASSASAGQFTLSRNLVRTALGKLALEVHYTDVYNTAFVPVSRDLKWFHRHQP
jgi:hypothetical protein